jgi:uncharacterized protein involved in type VI secretion and phage assembly
MSTRLFRPLAERVPFKTDDLPRCALDVVIRIGSTFIRSDVIRLQSFDGTEGISQLFEFQLELRANDNTYGARSSFDALQREKADLDEGEASFTTNYPDDLTAYPSYGTKLKDPNNVEDAGDVTGVALNFDDLLGSSVTVSIGLPVADLAPEHQARTYFNGMITAVSMSESGSYQVVMKPKLALLGMQSHYRAFQYKTILEVIEQVLQSNGVAVSTEAVFSTPHGEQSVVSGLAIYRRQDWLQAGETDLDFINRLMEKAGLFYYFIHGFDKHTMVLTDQCYYQSLWEEGEEGALRKLRKLYLSSTEGTQDKEYYITEYKLQQSLVPQGVSIVLAQRQAAWESQVTATARPKFDDVAGVQSQDYLLMQQAYTVAYGASEEELQIRKRLLEQQLSASKTSLSGASTCTELRSGYKFQVAESYAAEHPSLEWDKDMVPPAVRPELNGRVMVATSVTHKATIDGKYSNQFTAVESSAFAKPFEATGNNQATILAEVCRNPNSTPTAEPTRNQQWLVEQEDFVEVESGSFHAYDAGVTSYKPKGLYVRLITQQKSDTAIWARLSDTMTTIPELGAMVLVGRSSDETEIPEIQQVIEAKGSRNVMEQDFTVNTTSGDSHSANYGDSYRVSLSKRAATRENLNTAKTILEVNTAQNILGSNYIPKPNSSLSFDDVSVSDSSSFSVNHADASYSLSVSGQLPKGADGIVLQEADLLQMIKKDDDQNALMWDDYCQISRSISYGKTFSKTIAHGDAQNININYGLVTNFSKDHGDSESTSIQKGDVTSNSTVEGISRNTNISKGLSYSTTTNYADSENITNHTGLQRSTSLFNRSENITAQAAVSNITVTGESKSFDINGFSTSIVANVVTNSINLTGISTSVDLSTVSNTVQIVGPGFKVTNEAETPKAEVCTFETKIVIGIVCFI